MPSRYRSLFLDTFLISNDNLLCNTQIKVLESSVKRGLASTTFKETGNKIRRIFLFLLLQTI